MKRIFTSESVTEGHPDKVCDLISDSVLDEILAHDPGARVACETCATTGLVLVMGEITTECYVDVEAVARKTIADIGYNDPDIGFDARTCSVLSYIHRQSPDIAQGVDSSFESRKASQASGDGYDQCGAGDQGIMFGYACDETTELMPLPITLAHRLTARLTAVRKDGILPYLRPDGKSQVSVEYEGGVPKRVTAAVISAQHAPGVPHEKIEKDIIEQVIRQAVPENLLDGETKYYINPTGSFVTGGPAGDSGLTGRKIIVDTYGGYAPHGGGSFSGKDPTKVDRSASYMARYACKNVVAAGLAKKCELQLGYAIGVARPLAVYINTFGTGKLHDEAIGKIVSGVFDFRPRAIIDTLELRRPIYRSTTNYGHFGKPGLAWENTDRVRELLAEAKKY